MWVCIFTNCALCPPKRNDTDRCETRTWKHFWWSVWTNVPCNFRQPHCVWWQTPTWIWTASRTGRKPWRQWVSVWLFGCLCWTEWPLMRVCLWSSWYSCIPGDKIRMAFLRLTFWLTLLNTSESNEWILFCRTCKLCKYTMWSGHISL